MRTEVVARWDDLADRVPAGALVANVDLVIIRYDDEVSVLYGRCLHRGAMLVDGHVRGEDLICGVHDWDYRLATGVSAYNNEERLHKFKGWVEDGNVLVDVEEIEAAARGCRLELRSDQDLAVVGDPKLLRSGIENIVRNAIRFAPDGTTVEIEASRHGGTVKVAVSDRGPGVPVEHLERIFEPYFRVQAGTTDATGSGLGLAIAQRVFEVHGGSVVAEARPGGGLNVIAGLPLAELV